MAGKSLHVVQNFQWYDMVDRGIKKEEYRTINKYWSRRLCNQCVLWYEGEKATEPQYVDFKHFSKLVCHRGYTSQHLVRDIISIAIGYGKPEWGAPKDRKVFIIKFK